MPGFNGVTQFKPAGWKFESKAATPKKEPDGEKKAPVAYPAGM